MKNTSPGYASRPGGRRSKSDSLAVRDGLFRQIVIDDERVMPLSRKYSPMVTPV